VITSTTVHAQNLDSLRLRELTRELGSQVRVSARGFSRLDGRLIEIRSDTIVLANSREQRSLPFSRNDTLWVREPLGNAGTKTGAILGVIAAEAFVVLLRTSCGKGGDDPCTGNFAKPAIVLGLEGLALGAAAGWLGGQVFNRWVRKNP
jgi:hypothetical protein